MSKVMVLGSFVVDLMSRSPHFPEKGETVKSSFFKMGPGGKGFNQAVAAKRAGADLQAAIKLGRDEFAQVALNWMEKDGMDRSGVCYSEEVPTGAALILVDDSTGQNMISVYLGASADFNQQDLERLYPYIEGCEFLLLQLEINQWALEQVIAFAKSKGVKVILNPAPAAPLPETLLEGLYAVIPNEVEAKLITGIPVKEAGCEAAAGWFFRRGVQNVIITLGEDGVYADNGKKSRRVGIYPSTRAVDTTGAGDAFCGGFLAALGEGKDVFEAVEFGNVVGNLAVRRIGTAPAMPMREEIDRFLESPESCR